MGSHAVNGGAIQDLGWRPTRVGFGVECFFFCGGGGGLKV